ncbi:MAG TPA: hypothetical protein VNW72_14350 [Chthoniobacterales bacterium]|jgi:hypothetical protein|nr:hypothetical protein [Chthoniobacterales bacterium]
MPKQATLEITVPMTVDVDGAPNAYGPDDSKALDYELNAHEGDPPRKTNPIVGYLTRNDDGRTPILQGPDDPYPGFYISTSAFQHPTRDRLDPRKYCNAAKINYVVRASAAHNLGVRVGDFVVVHSKKYDKTVYGVVGDTGNSKGSEGSLSLVQGLGYPFKDGKNDSVDDPDIVIRYFANTNNQFFDTQEDLNAAAETADLDDQF